MPSGRITSICTELPICVDTPTQVHKVEFVHLAGCSDGESTSVQLVSFLGFLSNSTGTTEGNRH